MDFVEQHRRDAGEFGIVLDARDEDALGHHRHPRCRRAPRIHPRGIAEGLADILPGSGGHPLGGGARGEAAGGEQQDFAAAPWLVQQGGRDGGGLARPRRRDQHGVGCVAQVAEQVGQDGVDGEGG